MAKTAPKTPLPLDAEVVASETQERELITTEAGKFSEFIRGFVPFMQKAGELERKAKERLDIARQLKTKPPKTETDDVKVQTELRAGKLERKVVDETWAITGVLSRLHKQTVAGRERAGGMLDEATAITQQLHNDWTREQQRVAREEEDRRRRVAEEHARKDREKEVARIEEEALRVEAASPDISEREEAFVHGQIALGLGPTDAARRAGYKNPELRAEKLMVMPKIIAALDAKTQAAVIWEQAEARRAMPITMDVEKVRPAVTRVGNTHDRSTWSAEVYDAEAFMAALLDPRLRTQYGIPADIATFLQPKLNDYARFLHELLDKWPGVRSQKSTNTV